MSNNLTIKMILAIGLSIVFIASAVGSNILGTTFREEEKKESSLPVEWELLTETIAILQLVVLVFTKTSYILGLTILIILKKYLWGM